MRTTYAKCGHSSGTLLHFRMRKGTGGNGVSIVILQVKSCESVYSFQKKINYSVEYFIYLEISGITLYINLYLFFCSISLSIKYLKNNLLPFIASKPKFKPL